MYANTYHSGYPFVGICAWIALVDAVGSAAPPCRSSLGFMVAPRSANQLVPVMVEQLIGWRWGFAVLGLGPALVIAAIRQLDRYATVT